MRIGIVGAGMAGLSCATALTASGHHVQLFDKARGPGGRMATRRIETPLGTAAFDHGAQYFTARDPGFKAQVAAWAQQGVVENWTVPKGQVWVGTPAMSSVVKAMAASQQINWDCHIAGMQRKAQHWSLNSATEQFDDFDAIALAIPAEQATPFLSLHDFGMARQSISAPTQPCWTAMFAFNERLPTHEDIIHNEEVISWAARNSSKPKRSDLETWVVQASPAWSVEHLEAPAPVVAAALLNELGDSLGLVLPTPVVGTAHRWRFAMSAGSGEGALWNPALKLGVCGDWLLGPRVECAWLSGQALAQRIVDDEAKESTAPA
jgi:renalase